MVNQIFMVEGLFRLRGYEVFMVKVTVKPVSTGKMDKKNSALANSSSLHVRSR